MFDGETVAFLRSGCGLILATVDDAGEPRASRGWGLDPVQGHDRRFRVIVDSYDGSITDHFAAGRPVAVTATSVLTFRSLQMKGTIVAVEDANDEDNLRADNYCAAFFGDIHAMDDTQIQLLERLVPPAYRSCTIEITDAFDQTPGPRAGCAIDAASPSPDIDEAAER